MLAAELVDARVNAFAKRRKCQECTKVRLGTVCLVCETKGSSGSRHVCIQCLPSHHALHEMCKPPDYDHLTHFDHIWIKAEKKYSRKSHGTTKKKK